MFTGLGTSETIESDNYCQRKLLTSMKITDNQLFRNRLILVQVRLIGHFLEIQKKSRLINRIEKCLI